MQNVGAEPELIRSRFNRMVSLAVWLVCLVMFLSALAGGAEAVLRSTPAIALFAFAGWLMLWRPYLVMGDDAVALCNVTKTVTVPWAALIDVDTKYALTLVTPHQRITAWVAPAAGALTAQRLGRAARKRDSDTDGVGRAADTGTLPGELAGTESGDAARRVRTRWNMLLAAGRVPTGQAEATPVVTTWLRSHLTVLGLLGVLTVLGAVL
ncbi:MAG: PH domain-containing protein [Cryobacterium sp.]